MNEPAVTVVIPTLAADRRLRECLEALEKQTRRDFEIIVGKYLAALILYAAMLGLSLLSMLLLFGYGHPDARPMAVGYLGLLLQGGALLAIGTFVSTCTKNQIVAGVAGFAICLLLWVLDWVSSFETSVFARVLSYLSIITHYESFSKGVIDSKDIIFYISVIFVGLFLTARSMESLRWRA